MKRKSDSGNWNRRDFLKQAGMLGGLALATELAGCAQNAKPVAKADVVSAATAASPVDIAIVADPADAVAASQPAQWAIGHLAETLQSRGIQSRVYPSLEHAKGAGTCIIATGGDSKMWREASQDSGVVLWNVPEATSFHAGRSDTQSILFAAGRDAPGLVYALTDLADRAHHAPDAIGAIQSVKSSAERPANRIRSVMRLFASDVEDKSWFHDRSFWQRYLTMLVSQRFNRFNLALGLGYDNFTRVRDTYFFFAYPFLVNVPGYAVSVAGNLTIDEREQNLQSLKFISDEAAARGLHFQLGLWTHAYQWVDSPNANYSIHGLSADQHGPYCRDALQKVLETCPGIRGVTFRVHGESGVAEGSYDFWKTVFDGVVRTGRPIEIDMHAKGMDQRMIDVALGTGLPVNISPKFWAEHMGLPYHQSSIRENEMPKRSPATGQFSLSSGSRSFLRYGYGDLLRDDRKYGVLHRIWPGTQRLLLWADPKFAAEYGRIFSFCGSDGVEIFDPLGFKGRQGSGLRGDRGAYADETLKPPGGNWEKYLLTYRLFGRLTYNPDTDAEVWRRQLHSEVGTTSASLESALGHSSRILPLITTAHDPSGANFNYWPEIYTNMSIVDPSRPGSYTDTPIPRVFGNVSPLDPQLFATSNEFATSVVRGQPVAKVSPLEVAFQMEAWAQAAMADLTSTTGDSAAASSPAYRRASIDCAIASGLGQFFAWKLRAAVLYGVFDQTGYEPARQAALKAYRSARAAWAGLAARATGVYVADITFGPAAQLRGHWSDRLPAIDQDITAMESARSNAMKPLTTPTMDEAIARVADRPVSSGVRVQHTPPAYFFPGEPLPIMLAATGAGTVKLWYRHLNQAERWVAMEMDRKDAAFSASVPELYTDSPYPLQYYFEVRDKSGVARIAPGFKDDFCGQPYHVVRRKPT